MRSSSSCHRISKDSSSFLVLDSGYEVTMRIDIIDWINRITGCRGFLGLNSKVDDSHCFPISVLSVSCSKTSSTSPDRLFMQIRCSRLPDKLFRIVVSQSVLTATSRQHSCLIQFILYGPNYQSKKNIQLAI